MVAIVIVGLLVWVLVRSFSEKCIQTKKLNESCSATSECTGGLICSGGTCKVGFGETCSSTSECASGLECINGVCTVKTGRVNDQCPCDEGHTCVNNICKVIIGGPCTQDSDCVSNICENGVCLADLEALEAAQAANRRDDDSDDCDSFCYSEDYTSYAHSSKTDCTTDTGFIDTSDSKIRKYTESTGTSKTSSRSYYTCTDTDCSKSHYSHGSKSHYSKDTHCSEECSDDSDEYSEYSYISSYVTDTSSGRVKCPSDLTTDVSTY